MISNNAKMAALVSHALTKTAGAADPALADAVVQVIRAYSSLPIADRDVAVELGDRQRPMTITVNNAGVEMGDWLQTVMETHDVFVIRRDHRQETHAVLQAGPLLIRLTQRGAADPTLATLVLKVERPTGVGKLRRAIKMAEAELTGEVANAFVGHAPTNLSNGALVQALLRQRGRGMVGAMRRALAATAS